MLAVDFSVGKIGYYCWKWDRRLCSLGGHSVLNTSDPTQPHRPESLRSANHAISFMFILPGSWSDLSVIKKFIQLDSFM